MRNNRSTTMVWKLLVIHDGLKALQAVRAIFSEAALVVWCHVHCAHLRVMPVPSAAARRKAGSDIGMINRGRKTRVPWAGE